MKHLTWNTVGRSLAVLLIWTGSALAAKPVEVLKPTVPARQGSVEILQEVVITRQPKRYIGWPSIAQAENGDLIAVFSGDRDWHVDPWGKVQMVRSTDQGKSWSEPETIIDTPLDDRDVGITRLKDGSLLVAFNTSLAFDNPKIERYQKYREHAASLSKEVRDQWNGVFTLRSTDNGLSWSEPRRAPVATPHGPTALDDGRIMYVRGKVYESADKGETWSLVTTIQKDPKTWSSSYDFLSEQHAVQAADGTLVALSRYRDRKTNDNFLRQIISTDGGKTWTAPKKTEMSGYPAHLLRLDNGWLVASFGRRTAPMGERACISKDNGKTWLTDEEIVLSNAVPQSGADLGYPASVQLSDGSIWTVYYQVADEADGEYPALMGTHWRIVP